MTVLISEPLRTLFRARARRRWRLAIVALAALLAVGGCGSSSAHPQRRPLDATHDAPAAARAPVRGSTRQDQPAPSSLLVASAARQANGLLAARYTCTGADVSPPIAWTRPSGHVAEIVILVRLIAHAHVSTAWALAGVDPSLDSIAAGDVPHGAIVGATGAGGTRYALCPPRGVSGLVTIGVYALPERAHLRAGFNPSALTPALGASGVQWGATSARIAPR